MVMQVMIPIHSVCSTLLCKVLRKALDVGSELRRVQSFRNPYEFRWAVVLVLAHRPKISHFFPDMEPEPVP